ncbi:MAG: transcriptional regulator [Moraxellaceae bacterium]|nr:transcriptional regulator [Moraxellaceae bacterium]
MSFSTIKAQARTLFNEAVFLTQIHNAEEYEQALEFMDDLIEEYDTYEPLIVMLAASIERWENQAPEFTKFNQHISDLDSGVAVLRTLMSQHNLQTDDFHNEIGGKSMVSMILNGTRKLSKNHIQALSQRFNLSPALFFDTASH